MSSFVKHPFCSEECQLHEYNGDPECEDKCFYAEMDYVAKQPIFEQRETDEEARSDRMARARECK